MNRTQLVSWATSIVEDTDLTHVHSWLAENPTRRACGYLPVYAPRELIHAAGLLPVGVHGSERIEIIRGDAYYQSYICHLPRSVIELLLSGKLDAMSAMVFPSTCDVIRNLSGMWKVLRDKVYVRYLDLPQVKDPETGGRFYANELRVLLNDLGRVAGRVPTDDDVRRSLAVYNEVRAVLRDLYAARRDAPWRFSTEELYLLCRAGEQVPPEEFVAKARAFLEATAREPGRPRDNVRVVVVGSFCEQPPLGLIKTLERSGCYVVDDDFLLGNRLLDADVPTDGADPVLDFATTFLRSAKRTSILYEPDPTGKMRLVAELCKAAKADGVVFAAPSFCDPALLDRPMLRAGAEANGVPCIAFQYSENTGQFQQFREQAGTFSDALKLWGNA